MPGGDGVKIHARHALFEEREPDAPCGHLKRLARLALDLGVGAFEGHAEPLRQGAYEAVFLLRFAPQTVVHMKNDETLCGVPLLPALG